MAYFHPARSKKAKEKPLPRNLESKIRLTQSSPEEQERLLLTCFFVAPIGPEGSSTRAHSDALLKYVVKPVCMEAGYEVLRGDEDRRPGDITAQVIERVLESDLVIADLSFLNPNVFYEIGLRHAVARPIIHLYRVEGPLPFDVSTYRAITFEYDPWDVRKLEALRAALAEQVGHAQSGDYKGPVSQALAVADIQRSEAPGDAALRQIMTRLDELEEGRRHIGRPEPRSGGDTPWACPNCGSHHVSMRFRRPGDGEWSQLDCSFCHHRWSMKLDELGQTRGADARGSSSIVSRILNGASSNSLSDEDGQGEGD